MLKNVDSPDVSCCFSKQQAHPDSLRCLYCVCACSNTHICVGVRPPLGVSGPVSGSLWGTDPHLFACLLFPAGANGQPPSLAEETLSSSTRSQLPTGGANPSSWFGMTFQEGLYPAYQHLTQCKSETERRTPQGETREGSEGPACPGYGSLCPGWLNCKASLSRQNIHVSTLPQAHWDF